MKGFALDLVVSYRNSTSNHNWVGCIRTSLRLYLIEILHQTTTIPAALFPPPSLYLIEILHQTTTVQAFPMNAPLLYLIEILHQTTTISHLSQNQKGCILSKFYIKPQPWDWHVFYPTVVSYRNSTSNHNNDFVIVKSTKLYLIEILHQTTTFRRHECPPPVLYLIEILHQTTTSRRCFVRCF